MLADNAFGPYLLPCLAFLVVSIVLTSRKGRTKLPDLPWINYDPNKWFGKMRARLRTMTNFRESVSTAYTKFSKDSKSCILPSFSNDTILLPADCIEWLIAQPDSLVSNLDAIKDNLLPDHTLLRPEIVHNPTHHETIRGPLTRNLAGLVPYILDEVADAFDEVLGKDTKDFKEAVVFDTIIEVVARASNRVFVGLPLCRNKDLLAIAMRWAQLMPASASLLNQFPRFIHPILAPLVTFFNHWYARKYVKIVAPEVRRRQELSRSGKGEKPNDLLQWTVDLAEKSPLQSERDITTIALRLLVVNFAAIHTSTFSVTNAAIDLVCSDPSNIAQVRDEIHHALAVNGKKWDKGVLQHLIKLDSSMRESSRLGSFLGFGISRKIIAPDGITAPNGTDCPYGSTVAVPTNGIHNDSSIYEDAADFKPFRFVEMREVAATPDAATDPAAKKDKTHLINNAKLSFVSLSSQYHPFGYGRHACPGRFFAANELKLLLAYMFMNYEVETQAERPPYKWIGTTLLPPMTHKVKFRKIEASEKS